METGHRQKSNFSKNKVCLQLGFQFEPCCHCKCAEWSPYAVYTQHICLKIKIKMEKLLKMSSKFPEISIKAWSLTPSSAFGPVEIHPDNRLSCRKQLLWQNSGTSSSLFVFYWNMCFYIICSIHMRATQLSQCTFCDPSVRLQEQRKEWHFSQALTAPGCPLLLKTGALPCQKSHPLESR